MAGKNNRLKVGRGRLGWMLDGSPHTPDTAVLLEDDGREITLTVPWSSHQGAYERWFGGGLRMDDRDRSLYDYDVPEILWFQDVHGPVTLVGCSKGPSETNWPSGIGNGVASVSFAVFGARKDFRAIHGLRSALPSLGDWFGLRSVSRTTTKDDRNRYKSVQITVESPEPIQLDRRLNLTVRPTWETSSDEPDTTTIRDRLEVETLVTRPRSWDEHLSAHNAVRELLDISTWQANGYSDLKALRSDDPERAMGGRIMGERWAPVSTRRLRPALPSASSPKHLFVFGDIEVTGFRRWMRLRDRFQRGLDPMLGLLHYENPQVQAAIAQSGLAFEAIGYELAKEAGMDAGPAGRESHKVRLRRIAHSLPNDLLTGVIDDLDEWAARSAATYNSVKHADRDMPEVLTLLNTERENELVFRSWVAHRIGVGAARLHDALKRDRYASPWQLG